MLEKRGQPRWEVQGTLAVDLIPSDVSDRSRGTQRGLVVNFGRSGLRLKIHNAGAADLTQNYRILLGAEEKEATEGRVIWQEGAGPELQVGIQLNEGLPLDVFRKWLSIETPYLEAIVKEAGFRASPSSSRMQEFFLHDIQRLMAVLCDSADPIVQRRQNQDEPKNAKRDDLLEDACLSTILRGEHLLKTLNDKKMSRLIKKTFRQALEPWQEDNPFLKRGLEKPRGYPGDYMMMELGYRDSKATSGERTRELDRLLFRRYACVMNRKNKMKDILKKLICAHSPSTGLSILTLAGGPSREWVELDSEIGSRNGIAKVALTYLDYDSEAVSFSRDALEGNSLIKTREFCCESLLQYVRNEEWKTREGSFDLVYALGIADYFPDTILETIVQTSLRLLRTGGKFVVAHKDMGKFDFSCLDWLCDWTFLRRSEDHVHGLLERAIDAVDGDFQCVVDRETTGQIMFFEVMRRT